MSVLLGSAKVLVKGEPNVSYICSRYYRAPELIFGATDYTPDIGKHCRHCHHQRHHVFSKHCARVAKKLSAAAVALFTMN